MSKDIKIHNPFHQLNQAKARNFKPIKNDQRFIPNDFKKIAQGMESQFAQMMVKQMEQTATLSEEPQSTASSTYKGWLTSERAKVMSSSSNKLGLQDLILDEIYPQKFRNQASFDQYQKMEDAKFNKIKKNRDAIKNNVANDNDHSIKMKKLNELITKQEIVNE